MKPSAFLLATLLGLGVLAAPGIGAEPEGGQATFAASESLPSMVASVDVACILRTWRIVGVAVCFHNGLPTTCVIVENAYPCGILEAVRTPLASHMAEAEIFLKALAPIAPYGLTSSHTTDAASGTGLQFSEGHAFEFVPQIPIVSQALPIVVPPGRPFAVSYFSEVDGFAWRTGIADLVADPRAAAEKAALPSCSVAPRLDDCAWTWGSYFPRSGFTVHPSEVMAGYLFALRAGRVGARPLGRVIESPYSYEPRTGHYIQMVRPSRRGCFSIGLPATRLIEGGGALSKEGAYLTIHFGIFQECKGCWTARLAEARPPAP